MKVIQRVIDPETGKTFKLTILLDHLVSEDGQVTKMEEIDAKRELCKS